MPKSGSRSRSTGGNGKVKKMAIVPEETVAKLNTVLSGLIARPQPPSRPEVVRLDELQRELDHAKQLEDPVARMAAVTRGYDNWRREYNKFLGGVNPAPTTSFIPSLPSVSTTVSSSFSSRPTSPTSSKSDTKEEDETEDEEATETVSDGGSFKQEDKPLKLDLNFVCPDCGRQFKSQGGLTRHAKKKHKMWMGQAATPEGLQRMKTETDTAKNGKGIVFYPASSRR